MKYLLIAALLALVALGVAGEVQRRRSAAAEAQRDAVALEAAKTKRAALEADTRGRQEIARLKGVAARHEAEVKRLRGQAAVAAREVRTVQQAGEALQATGTTDEIMAALVARGYHPERCRPVPVQR